MTKDKAALRIAELAKALARLEEMIAAPAEHLGRVDAIVQRFEFSYELCWKALKAALEIYGHETASPWQAFKKAYAMRWIDEEQLWRTMLDDRNLTSHTYKEETAIAITQRIPAYAAAMRALQEKLAEIL